MEGGAIVGAHRRKRPSDPAAHAARVEELVAQFSAMQEEGKGRWKLSVVSGPDVIRAVFFGEGIDEDLAECLSVIGPALVQLKDGKRPDFSCLLCGVNLGGTPWAFIVLRSYAFGPRGAMLQGLCMDCAFSEGLLEKILAFYRKNIISDLQVVGTVAETPEQTM